MKEDGTVWKGKNKALTFSYDDGCYEDKRLCELLDRYMMKGTFNIIGSRLIKNERIPEGTKRLSIDDMREVYKNHEVAMHTYTHPHLTDLGPESIKYEVLADRARIEESLGVEPVGLAYPMGAYNETVLDVLRECKVKYARTNKSTYNFELPTDLLQFSFTCRHRESRLMELAERFVKLEADRPQLFCLMGHSYEFKTEEDWAVIERFCEYMAGRDDIYYCTNAQALL